MYHYEVFVLKGDEVPALLQSFTKTHETRFYDVYTHAVPQEEHYQLDAQLQLLQNVLDIGHYYWCYISEKREPNTEQVQVIQEVPL